MRESDISPPSPGGAHPSVVDDEIARAEPASRPCQVQVADARRAQVAVLVPGGLLVDPVEVDALENTGRGERMYDIYSLMMFTGPP